MIVIPNNIIPFPGYVAINIFGLVFVRKDIWEKRSDEKKQQTLNHEAIHTAQMRELLFVFFYIIYFFEWIYRLIFHTKTAYRGISFEKEAYEHENDKDYLKTRKHYAQWRNGRQ